MDIKPADKDAMGFKWEDFVALFDQKQVSGVELEGEGGWTNFIKSISVTKWKQLSYKQKQLLDKVTVNLGPQHPSTHGVFRMVVSLDGETIVGLKPVMGYLHRNHEKIGERNTFIMNMPYTDRLDYLSSLSNNLGYAMTIENLMDIKVTERAEWLRILMAELTRISNHLWAVGFLLNDLGALQTPMIYFYIERELILDFFEAVTGAVYLDRGYEAVGQRDVAGLSSSHAERPEGCPHMLVFFQRGQHLADRPGAWIVFVADRDDRRAFRRAVGLQDDDLWTAPDQGSVDPFGALFGPANAQAERGKLLAGRSADDPVHEGRRAGQERRAIGFDHLA